MKWIVVDFGTQQTKILALSYEGQKISIENFHAFASKPEFFKGLAFPEPAAWAATTITLNELNWLQPDEDVFVIATLPSAYLETRYLKFPFRSEKKIEKVLQFELESTLPFDIDEVQVRSQIVEGDGVPGNRKDTQMLVMAYRRQLIRQVETELRKFQLSNPPITAHSLALSSLRQFISDEPLYVMISFGHAQSHMLLMQRSGSILGVRTLWWGGKNLIDALQEEFQVDAEKARQLLLNLDAQKPPSKQIETSVKQLTTEIRQALKGFVTTGIQLPKPLPVYVFGGVTRYSPAMKLLEDGLTAEFSANLRPFPFTALRSKQIQGLEKIDSADLELALPALSIALTQTRTHRSKIPSFSETGFQFQQNLRKFKTGSFSLLKHVAALLIAPFIYAAIQITIQSKENKVLVSALPQILQGTGIQFDANSATDEITNRLKKELAQNRTKITQLSENKESPLRALSELSTAIPSFLKIDIKEMKISRSTISFSAETPTADSATRIIEALQRVYSQVKTGATTNCATATKTECKFFKVEIERPKGT